jgi:small conductance mechanosensitive channel
MKWDWTKFYDKLYDWIILKGPGILIAIFMFILGTWLIRVFNRWLKRFFERRRFNPSLRYFLQNLIAISFQIILVLLVLQVAGVRPTIFTAIVAGLSVAAGLALSGTLQNFVSGVLILLLRPYVVGDNVVMQGQEGRVTSIQIFHTFILTPDNKTIIVPNGQLSNNIVVNLSRQGMRRIDIVLKFSYAIPLDDSKQVLQRAIAATQGLLDHPPSRVSVGELEFDKYNLDLQVWVNPGKYEESKFILQEKIMDEMKKAALVIPAK